MKRVSGKVFLLVCIAVVAGCGYTTRGFVYADKKIFVVPVLNKVDFTKEARRFSDYRTYPLLIEKQLTNEIVNRFNIDGHLDVVQNEPDALNLSCVIKDYRKQALRYTESDDVQEQRLRLVVHMKLTGAGDQVLQDRDVTGETTFFLTGPNSKNEQDAQSDLISDTARRIVEAVIEEW